MKLYETFQTLRNIHKPFKTFQQNLSKPFKTFQNLSKPFKTFQNLSSPKSFFSTPLYTPHPVHACNRQARSQHNYRLQQLDNNAVLPGCQLERRPSRADEARRPELSQRGLATNHHGVSRVQSSAFV